ncbi:MAG: class I SAM-dependent methyltransferase [Candidatus Bathyarchaeia archaeon]
MSWSEAVREYIRKKNEKGEECSIAEPVLIAGKAMKRIYRKLVSHRREFIRRKLLHSFSNEPWMKRIIECQHEIVSLKPNPLWLKYQRDYEIYFWLHIPKWIMEDWINQKVDKCLDIGCGVGVIALYCKKLLNCEVYCTDCVDIYLNPALIKKYNFTFNVNNIEIDPFPWNYKFDVIIFTEVLEHLNFHPIPTLKKYADCYPTMASCI